jgi:hypothetical protein
MRQLTSPVEIYWISGSPFAWRVLLTAEVKGVPYEGKLLEASKGELKSPEFLAINPLGRVPAIRDGNFKAGADRRQCQMAAAGCTAAYLRALRRVIGMPTNMAVTAPRPSPTGGSSPRCCAT